MEVFVFPSERAKALRGDPARWYHLATEYLALPAAFREAAKALRATIRGRRKSGDPVEEPLADLYRLACLENLILGGDQKGDWRGRFSEPLPRELWVGEEFDYRQIGHEHLTLLGVHDRKWMEDAWGAPEAHRTLQGLYPDLEQRLSEHFRAAWKRERERDGERNRAILAQFGSTGAARSEGGGCHQVLVLFAIALAVPALLIVIGW